MNPVIPVARPRLPAAARIMPYLAEIDANGWYSNFGPLTHRFQARLANHFGVRATELTVLASGTVAITLALLASGVASGSRCLMPSWTFAASAGGVRAAGLRPHFVDVDARTWALDPAAMLPLARRGGVGAILVVAPFGAPLDLDAWDTVSRLAGCPVVIDAAAAFDTLRHDGPMRPGRNPVVVSLHATKVFGIGEGGAVLSRDEAWVERMRRLSNFGFLGNREAAAPGLNGKMSEYAAAVGLASLDAWRATRARWAGLTRAYHAQLGPAGVTLPPGFGQGWVSSTLPVLWPGDASEGSAHLAEAGVASLRWWGAGCHAQPAYRDCLAEPLPVTDRLARACIGLPFWRDLTPAQVEHVCTVVRRHARSGADALVLA